MRKVFVPVILSVVLLMTSCATGSSEIPAREVPENLLEYVQYSADFTLKNDGKLHFYFLSASNGFVRISEKTGDATLILFPNGQTMLIDSCTREYSPVLITSLLRMGITRIDYFVLSHSHGDHYGGFVASDPLLNYFDVGVCYYNGVNVNYFKNVSSKAKKYSIPIEVLSEGDVLHIGDVDISVISPDSSVIGTTINEESRVNDTSLVLRFDYDDFSALFTGDLYVNGEADLIKRHEELLDVDLLKICHHGRNTSSSTVFINAVSPKLSVALGNCPMDTMLYSNYKEHGSDVLMDFCDGYVHVWTAGKGMKYEHSLERTIILYD